MTQTFSPRVNSRSLWAEQKRVLKKSTNEPGMSLKTKDRCGKLGGEAGMSMKTKEIVVKGGNLVENEGLNTTGGEYEMIEDPSAITRDSSHMALLPLSPNPWCVSGGTLPPRPQ
jgi:hypothetical protein